MYLSHRFYFSIAQDASNNSTCRRRKVGCVLVDKDGDILKVGWNRPPAALKLDCWGSGKSCPDADIPKGAGKDKRIRCWGQHAESVALMYMSIKERSKIYSCYCTKAPCTLCILDLLETRCERIIFVIPSGETWNEELWKQANREWIQWTPAIARWNTI